MAILHGSWLPASEQGDTNRSTPQSPISGQQPLNGTFFLWAEIWRSETTKKRNVLEKICPHPLSLNAPELSQFLISLNAAKQLFLSEPILTTLTSGPKHKKSRPTKSRSQAWTAPEPVQWTSQVIVVPALAEKEQLIPLHSSSAVAVDTSPQLYPFAVQGLELSPAQTLDFLAALPLHSHTAEESFLGAELIFWSHAARWGLDLLTRAKFYSCHHCTYRRVLLLLLATSAR